MRNAIVLMFDSLQYNYLGCYGNTWIQTPNMDRLAREGVLFENCYIEGLPTIPCRRAMHTGRFTLPVNGWSPLTMEDTTIADLCWGRPIDTALIFDAAPYRMPKFGYTRGFDKVWFTHGHEGDDSFYEDDQLYHLRVDDYLDEETKNAFAERMGEHFRENIDIELENYLKQRQYGGGDEENRYVAKTIRKAIEYLEQVDKNKQFYLWVDSFDPHEPWDPPSIYRGEDCMYDPGYTRKHMCMGYGDAVEGLMDEEQLHHIRMLYAELVTLCDKYLGKFMDAIRRLGLEENTLFMMVSDHGEPMGNGEHGHGILRKCRPWPYEELVHTPMLLRAPGVKAGQRIKAFVQSVDVAPTVCDWLGIGVHPDMQGKSLLPLVRGEVEKVHDFAIAGYYKYSWSIITEDWSYIHWLKNEKGNTLAAEFFTEGMDTSHLQGLQGGARGLAKTLVENTEAMEQGLRGNAGERYQALVSVDGTEQWTCTPGTRVDVPEVDELYNRKTDPFQLHNVITQHPDVASDLFNTLREYMAALKAS